MIVHRAITSFVLLLLATLPVEAQSLPPTASPELPQQGATFAEHIKDTALTGTANVSRQLWERSITTATIAQHLNTHKRLESVDFETLSGLIGGAATDAIAANPKVGAATLRKISVASRQEAQKLDLLGTKLINQSPSTVLTSLDTYSKTSSPFGFFNGAPQPAVAIMPDRTFSLKPLMGIWGDRGGPTATNYQSVGVLMLWDGRNAYVPTCTGTLVRSNKILTAAHCFCPWSGDTAVTLDYCRSQSFNKLAGC